MCEDNYIEVSKKITAILEKVVDIAMPVIGDISIYSTFVNFSHYAQELGFKIKVISSIPSFIAAADALNIGMVNQRLKTDFSKLSDDEGYLALILVD